MGIGETDGLLGNEESRRLWSEPYQIEVPRLADGKLGFSIVVEKFNDGTLSELSNVKVSIVKENCLSKELRKSLYITKIDGADIRHLQKLTDVKDVLRNSTGTVVLLEAQERLSLCSDDEDQMMNMNCNDDSFAGSSNCSSGSSYSTGSMNSLLQQSSSHCRRFFPHGQSLRLSSLPLPQLSQPHSNGSLSSIMETLSLQQAVFLYPDRIKWDCKTKKIQLKSEDGTFNFDYDIIPSSTNSLQSSMDSSMFCLVTHVQGQTVGKLKRGDLILSLNRIPCQHDSVRKKINDILRTNSEITLIIQRPVKFEQELLRDLELLQKVIYPTRRVFMVGSGAGTYFNSFGVKYDFLGLAYNHNHPYLPPIKTTAFKACCVHRIGNRTFSVSPWNTRWQSAGCSLLGDQVQQDVIELLAIFDESFFHNCMNISFTKDSIFLVMVECDKMNGNKEVSRILHTIHTCIGKDAIVRLFVVCQHGISQCAHATNHQSYLNKIRQTKLLEVPMSPNHNAVDSYFSSLFDIVHNTKPLQVNQATLRFLSERKKTETNVIPNLCLSVKEMFKMFTENDTLDVVADLKEMREFIGVDLKDRPIRSALHPSRQPHSSIYFAANIEFLLTAMSQMAYPILSGRSSNIQEQQQSLIVASTLIHRSLILKHLQPHESNALEIFSVLESNKVIFGLKSCGQRLTNNYYVPFLQQNVSLKLNSLPETPYVLYIDFTTNILCTDFLELVVCFGNSQGWDFSQELQLCLCQVLFEKFVFIFEFRPLIKQIRIVPRNKFTKEQHWASLISFWRQLTNVCKHVFPLNMLKEHSRCNRASCIYCGIERNSGPLIVRCNYLESPTNKGPSEQSKKKQVPSVEKTLVFNANYNVIKCICDGLNERPEYGWKKIAAHLNISLTHVNSCENCKDPSESLLWDWSASDVNCTILDLRNILYEINRLDLVRILENYMKQVKKEGGSVGAGSSSMTSSSCSSIRSHAGVCSSSASCSGTASSTDISH